LTSIEQFYVQDGKEIHHQNCADDGNDNAESDALALLATGEASDRGMVLLISMWHELVGVCHGLRSF